MRRSHLVLAVILVAVVVVVILLVALWVNEGPLWRWVMLKRVDHEGYHGYFVSLVIINGHFPPPTRGWKTVKRWTDHPIWYGKMVLYYVETGMKSAEGEIYAGPSSHATLWNLDGTIQQQRRVDPNRYWEVKDAPPWWWPVTDQTEPTAPWWSEKK